MSPDLKSVPPVDDAGYPLILIIEDVPNVVRFVRAALEDRPVRLVSTASGAEGIEMIRSLKPLLVLLDLALPGIDGWEVLRRVRNDPALAATPVVIMTATGDSEIAKQSQTSGADGFMAKPFMPDRLRRMVDHFLQAA